MEGVVLLSEINPRGWVVHPLAQANEWFGLLNDNDIAKLQSEPNLEFEKCIELIYERCIESGNQLVIRDWNHLDFVALPYLSTQTNRLSLIDSLQNTYDTNQVCLVRHPMDQCLSIIRLQIWAKYGKFEFGLLLRSMRLFAEYASKIGFIRYEDFARNHEKVLHKSCLMLGINFDHNYTLNWNRYEKITGNVNGSRGGTGQIKVLPRRQFPKDKITQLLANSDYQITCELLGYEP